MYIRCLSNFKNGEGDHVCSRRTTCVANMRIIIRRSCNKINEILQKLPYSAAEKVSPIC